MTEFDSNPYAAPACDATQGADLASLERGPMPSAVIVVVCLLGVIAAILAYFTVAQHVAFTFPIVFTGLLMLGLFKGYRMAWRCGRALGAFGGLYLAFSVPSIAAIMLAATKSLDAASLLTIVVGAFSILLLITCWFMFFTLGTPASRRFFDINR